MPRLRNADRQQFALQIAQPIALDFLRAAEAYDPTSGVVAAEPRPYDSFFAEGSASTAFGNFLTGPASFWLLAAGLATEDELAGWEAEEAARGERDQRGGRVLEGLGPRLQKQERPHDHHAGGQP